MKKAKPLAYFAAGALLASAVTHVTTFFAINPTRRFPPVLILHVLIGVVWIPMILMTHKICTGSDRWRFWSIITRHAPLWMKALAITLAGYAFFNFFFTGFVLTNGGEPAIRRGAKVLVSRGKVVRELADD